MIVASTSTLSFVFVAFLATLLPCNHMVQAWSSPPPHGRLHYDCPPPASTVSRRHVLTKATTTTTLLPSLLLLLVTTTPSLPVQAAKDLSEEYRQGTLALQDMNEDQAPVPQQAYKKLPSGVVYADLRRGGGATVSPGSKVNIQWVLRKSNGYFVDSSAVQDSVPFIFTVGDGTAIAGLDEGIVGMQEGGVRRILMPPALAYVEGLEDGKPGPVPAGYGPRQQMRRVQTIRKDVPGEYVFLEIQATRVR